MNLDYKIVQQNVKQALAEDIADGDKSAALISPIAMAEAKLIVREEAVVAGIPWFNEIFLQVNPDVVIDWHVKEGEFIPPNHVLSHIRGPAAAILTAERTALNFLQLLSGVATQTYRYIESIRHTKAKLLDTRKTLPNLRYAQKYAVRCGGGMNHRFGLYDAMMIKENHIMAAGSITTAVHRAREYYPNLPLIVEVENLAELKEALACGVKRILLDNFDVANLQEAVKINAKQAQLEVSGGINQETIKEIAETGIDFISVGKLTKDVLAIDFSLTFNYVNR